MPEDPVTITVVRDDAKTTFRYWQLFLHQILTTLQTILVFVIFTSNSYEKFSHVTFILCCMVLGLTVASMVLTYFYSTDTFILFVLFFIWRLHRLYPHQVPHVN